MSDWKERYVNRMEKAGYSDVDAITKEQRNSFLAFLAGSPNRVEFISDGRQLEGVLQSQKTMEGDSIDVLLTHYNSPIREGSVIRIGEKHWLALAEHRKNIESYRKFILGETHIELKWYNKNKELLTCRAHFGKNFNFNQNEVIVRNYAIGTLPDAGVVATIPKTPTTIELKRGGRFIIESDAFEIVGINKVYSQFLIYLALNEVPYNEELDGGGISVAHNPIEQTVTSNKLTLTGPSVIKWPYGSAAYTVTPSLTPVFFLLEKTDGAPILMESSSNVATISITQDQYVGKCTLKVYSDAEHTNLLLEKEISIHDMFMS